ncbi:COG1470 family protein [Streptomyces sp. NPDC002537]
MSVRAELTAPEDTITPGDSLTAHLRVWNESRIVDAYELRLLGPPAAWPDTDEALGQLPIYPGNHEKINIPLTLPRVGELKPGQLTFAVRVASVEDPDAVAVPEADITVGEFHEVEPTLSRSRAGGALWSSNLIVLENTGNATANVRLRVAPEAKEAPIRAKLRRSKLTLKVGEKARVSLMVRVMKPVFTGKAADWRIGVHVDWDHEGEHTVSFVHRQRPLIPKPALKVLTVAVAGLVAFAALWMSPIGGKKPKPQTESAKGPSQVEQVQQQEKQTADEKKKDDEKKDKAKKEKEEEGAPKKQEFSRSLSTYSKSGRLKDTYVVKKGYRLVVKTVQITASGPATGSVILSTGTEDLSTQNIAGIKDFTPAATLSLEAGEKLILKLVCAPPQANGGSAPAPSGSGAPLAPSDSMATAVVTGELIPLTGPNAEPDKSQVTS